MANEVVKASCAGIDRETTRFTVGKEYVGRRNGDLHVATFIDDNGHEFVLVTRDRVERFSLGSMGDTGCARYKAAFAYFDIRVIKETP